MRGVTIYDTAIRIYNKIKSKPITYTQLKNELKISNSTISLCLQKLKNEDLIEKTIINDEPHYTITKNNLIEKIQSVHDKNLDKERVKFFATEFLLLATYAELYPEKYTIRYQYLKNYIIKNEKDIIIKGIQKNYPASLIIDPSDEPISLILERWKKFQQTNDKLPKPITKIKKD